MTRRTILPSLLPTLLATASIALLSACGSSDGSPLPPVASSGSTAPHGTTPTDTTPTDTTPTGTTPTDTTPTGTAPTEVRPETHFFEAFDLPSDPDARLISLTIGEPHGQRPVHDVSVTVDGRVFLPAMGPDGVQAPPGSAPQPFVVRRLTEAGLDVLIEAGTQNGMFVEESDYSDAGISDQGFTTVTLLTAQGEITHRAYALEFEGDTAEGEANRTHLRTLVDTLLDLRHLVDPAVIGDAVPYEPSTWTVDARRGYFDRDVDGDGEDDDRIWPESPDVVGPCVDLDESLFDGDVAGSYRVQGSEVPGEDGRNETVTIIEAVPAFPWIDCDA